MQTLKIIFDMTLMLESPVSKEPRKLGYSHQSAVMIAMASLCASELNTRFGQRVAQGVMALIWRLADLLHAHLKKPTIIVECPSSQDRCFMLFFFFFGGGILQGECNTAIT
jgi:hypothetical protein